MQQRRKLVPKALRPTTAFVSALAVIGSTLVGLQATNILSTEGSSIDPITPTVESTNLSDGSNIVVEDAAIAAQGGETGARTVKEFSREEPFSMVAVTWEGSKDVAVFVRALREDGSWSEWYDTDPYDLSDAVDSGREGTELIYVEPTTTVQVSMSGVDFYADSATNTASDAGAAQEATISSLSGDEAAAPTPLDYDSIAPVAEVSDPNNYSVVFIDGGESELPENGINLTSDAIGMPTVISRAGWGADESMRCRDTQYFDGGVTGLTVHHTAGSNNYTESQAPGIVRGIYAYHAKTLGWCDIGYQSLVDKYGNIYEGRYGGMNRDVWGAHAGGFNKNTWAVSMMGNYEDSPTTTAMIESVGNLLGWRAAVAGLDPTGTNTHISEGTSYSKYARGTAVSLPNIFAHRDVGLTTCPGNYGYAQMGNIRAIAKTKYESVLNGRNTNTTEATTTSVTPESPATSSAATTTTPDAVVTTTTPTRDATLGDAQTVTSTSPQVSPAPNTSAPAPANPYVNYQAEAVALINNLINNPTAETATDAVNSLVALGLRAIANGGVSLGSLVQNGGVELVGGLTLAALPAVAANLLQLDGNSPIERAWAQLKALVGDVLGNARSAIQSYISSLTGTKVQYALFDNGIIVSNEQTGTHALWGALGDAWAGQGFDIGPLGLPTSTQELANGTYTAEFENGSISWTPANGSVDINTNS